MRTFGSILSASFLMLFASIAQGTQAQVVVQDRINQPVESASMAALQGSVHPLARAEYDQGVADNAKLLTGLTVNFKRSDEQEANLKALLQAQQDPSSSSYHKWLTPAQFGQQFGMSASDLGKVSAWLQQEGFTVAYTSQSDNSISFSGSIAAVENAFQTSIHNYLVNGETHFANATPVSVPGALGGLVSSVRGLNDFRLKPRLRFPKTSLSTTNPHFTSGLSGEHYVAPGDFATIYDVSPLTGGAPNWSGTYTGKGVTIAVMGQTAIVAADITDFRGAAGLPTNTPTVVTVPNTTPETVAQGAGTDLEETDLDLEWSGGVATGANVVLINSDAVFDSLQYVLQNQVNGITIPIVSQSYGDCEANYATAELNTIEGWLEQGNSQGQTIILAAGDTGAADCEASTATSATKGLAVDYPGSSAYVTDMGGSEFMGDGTAASPQTGAGTYWNSNGTSGTSDDLLTSAKSYIPEMAWNDTTFSTDNSGGLSAGGGGVSALWTKPTWQMGVSGIPADGKRDVPDLSLNASPDHDGYLYCTQVEDNGSPAAYVSSCQANSFRLSDGNQSDNNDLQVVGGTSVAAPTFAGLLAIFEQKIGSGGLGNINSTIYAMAANSTTYASAFHDITTGNNEVPCTTGTTDCPTGTTEIGYSAGTGYDQATGLGSIDANNFATAFATETNETSSTTALAYTPAGSLDIGEAVTFTATVAPSSGTAAPTGTVTFMVDGVASGSAVTLSSGSPYTATLKTSFSTAGSHTVTATYSGDSTYKTSSSSVTVTVVSSGTAATTTTVTANPTSFAIGSSVTLTATVSATSSGPLTGPVTFTTGGVTIGKVNQVALGTGDTATATLTVTSSSTLGFAAGTDTITAAYGGDSYNSTSSGTATVMVTNPSITIAATNVTISSPSPGNSGTSTITITSAGGYAGTVVVSATAGSLDADYSFGSSNSTTGNVAVASAGAGSTTLTIETTSTSSEAQKGLAGKFRRSAGRAAIAGGTLLGSLALLLLPGIRRRRWPAAVVMLVFLGVVSGIGCGGGGGSSAAAPAGTYTVTVTGTDSSTASIAASTTFTVTIQ